MNLHHNPQLFLDAITLASQPVANGGLGISPLLIEKDYWICRSVKLMSQNDTDHRAVFQGGTSLSKAYSIGHRFSEDIDIAISRSWELSGNQLKNLIRRTAHTMTQGLKEFNVPGSTSKGSHYHKAYYHYPQATTTNLPIPINPGQLLIEINSFANPYPSETRIINSFLSNFLAQHPQGVHLIDEYALQPFAVEVLDKRRTLTEKLVSLIRFSLSEQPILQLSSRIRHFYDLHYLLQDTECLEYFKSNQFHTDFESLLSHDRETFTHPTGWQTRHTQDSPLLQDPVGTWRQLTPTYLRELPSLSYLSIPDPKEIASSLITLIKPLCP